MKKKLFQSLITLSFVGSMLLGCSSKTSIKYEQGIQILDMIIYKQDGQALPENVSFTHRIVEGDGSVTVCIYEISNKDNMIHVYDTGVGLKESWYYIDSGTLYYSFRNSDGEIMSTHLTDDPVAAAGTFLTYSKDYLVTAVEKIGEVDRPSYFRNELDSLKNLNEKEYVARFQTRKNYHLLSDVKIYENASKAKLLRTLKFEYSDAKLIYFLTQEENNPATEYVIDYNKTLSKDSIN